MFIFNINLVKTLGL